MKIVFRCDATSGTGLGHLSRSVALAEALRRAGAASLFVGHWNGIAFTLLDEAGFAHRPVSTATGTGLDAEYLADFVAAEEADGVVVDSYLLQEDWIARLARREVKVVLIDDFGSLPDYAGCAGVINFTVGAAGLSFPGLPKKQLAAGPEFFPAREKLVQLRKKTGGARGRECNRVLVALGGGDRLGMTVPIYRALRRIRPGLEVRAIAPHGAELARTAGLDPADFPPQAGDLAGHYAWADSCVSGGGLTKYECGYLGLPVAIFSQTEHEQAETKLFCATGIGRDLADSRDGADWETRLGAFLNDDFKSKAAWDAACRLFPMDSDQRVSAAVFRFLAGVAVPTTILS
jgi:UDP-2,4-diacetamido-2,4,6-trideoxy-beta-L-altropyranose hydrolase